VNDRLDNRSFVLIAGERLTASIDSHTAATTTSVTSPTERTSMFASRNPLSAWSCGPSPRSARCSTCPRPRRSRIPSRHGRQWSVWDSVRVNVQKLVRSSARTSAGAGDRADPDSHLWGWSSSRTTSTASRRSGPLRDGAPGFSRSTVIAVARAGVGRRSSGVPVRLIRLRRSTRHRRTRTRSRCPALPVRLAARGLRRRCQGRRGRRPSLF
jgi:hypothetical protein